MVRNPDWGRPASTLIFASVCSQCKGTFGAKKSPNDPMIFNASFFQAISKLPILWHPDLPSTSNLTPHAACGSFWVQCWELMAVLPGEVLTQAISAGVEVNDVEKCLGDLGDSDIKWWEQSGRNLPNWLVLETGEVSSDSARCFKWWIHVPGWWIKQPFNNRVQRCWDAEALQHFPGPMNFLGHAAFFGTVWSQLYNSSSLRSKDFQASEIDPSERFQELEIRWYHGSSSSSFHCCCYSISPTIRQN